MQIHEFVFVRHLSNIFLFVHECYRRNRSDIFEENQNRISSFLFVLLSFDNRCQRNDVFLICRIELFDETIDNKFQNGRI